MTPASVAGGRYTGSAMSILTPPAARRPPRVPKDFAGEPAECGPRGKPTPAMLRAVGDPPDGFPMSDAQFDAMTTEFGVELVNGRLDYLPMPFDLHAGIVHFLTLAFADHLRAAGSSAVLRGSKIRIRIPESARTTRNTREPDLVLLLDPDDERRGPEVWTGADLCIEVVSPDDPDRDYILKRPEYAAAGVLEYWIVDPRPRTAADDRGRSIRVLTLDGDAYRERAFGEGETAAGTLLPGLTVEVTACLAGA